MPAKMDVMTKPAIIIIQTIDAAAGLLLAETRVANKVSNDVPEAPTPIPIMIKAKMDNRIAGQK